MKKFKIDESNLDDEMIWGLAYNTGTRKEAVADILKKYDLDIEKTFHWFNSERKGNLRNAKQAELIGLFTGHDSEAIKIAAFIKNDKAYKK